MNPGLELTPAQMREYGHRVIDRIVHHLSTLPDQRVGTKADPAAILAKYSQDPPEQGSDFAGLLQQIETDILQNTMHVNHPRFFAYVPSPGNYIGVLADALAAGYNVFSGTWISGSGPAALELEVIRWLCGFCGYPAGSGGLFVSGGTMANLTAVAVARHALLGEDEGSVYFSDQTHSSIEKDLRVLGFRRRNARKLKCDDRFRLSLEHLRAEVLQDRRSGQRPFCVIANAGTTNTGAVDPLPELARFCKEEGLWLHVDGAYGAAAVICERRRSMLDGTELADSISLDPHKWLFQPFECGCVLVRDIRLLRNAFTVLPEYLIDTHQVSAEINLTDYGIQLTRGCRALKLWLTIQYFGMRSLRLAVERGFELAELAQAELERMPDWEIVTPAQMGIICFRYRGGDDAFHLRIVQQILADGYALVTSTILNGRSLLRICAINPRTTDEDLKRTLQKLDLLASTGRP
jgi:glutamate/tyrosine decarboxylase-like PLP-dependent enzyme